MARAAYVAEDGSDSTDQGDYFPHQSHGTKIVVCDPPTLVNWWDLLPKIIEPTPRPVDEQGVPYELCSDCGQYVRRAGFSKDASRKNGLKAYCKVCCNTREHVRRVREAAEENRTLRDKRGRPPKYVARNA